MPDENQILGKKGEAAAVSFLETLGLTILETNYRTRMAEIDIIARDRDWLCFIEVKTRRSLKKGLPKESVTPVKQQKIVLGAQVYLKTTGQENTRMRFDVVEVYPDRDGDQINYIKHAFQAR